MPHADLDTLAPDLFNEVPDVEIDMTVDARLADIVKKTAYAFTFG